MEKWITLAPINAYFDSENKLSIPFSFDNSLSLNFLPEWTKNNEFTKHMSFYQREGIIKESKLAFLAEYDAESLGDSDSTRTGQETSVCSKQDVAAEKITFANISLWIIMPSSLGYQMILHNNESDGEWFLRQMYTVNDIRIDESQFENRLTNENLECAKNLYSIICQLPRKNSLWIAIRSIQHALMLPSWEFSFLLFWVSLEALFGTASELTYRLALRTANFLAEDRQEAKKIFSDIKKIYQHRSKVVHGRGAPGKGIDDRREMMLETQTLLRCSLSKILLSKDKINVFNSEGRDEYLDELCLKQ